jgi:methionyl aminopeptidase
MSLVKSPEEVEKMRISGALLARCLDVVVVCSQAGRSAKEVDTVAEEFIRDHGAVPAFKNYDPGTGIKFPASVCFSRNKVVVHGIPVEDMIIEEGDIITIDCGLSLDGWFADAARLFGVGEISEEDKNMVAWSRRVLSAGIGACVVGNKLGDISYTLQVEIGRSPYCNITQFCGHFIGQAMHEEPQVPNFGKKNTGIDLEPGMVLCLEPMLKKTKTPLGVLPDNWTIATRDGTRATHIEEMVLITEDKPEILTA